MLVGYSFQISISLCWNNKRCCHFLIYKQLLTFPVIFFLICKQKFWFQKRKHSQLSLKRSRVRIEMNYEKFVISTKWDTCLEWITNWHYPELRGYFTLKSLLHSGLKQVMSLSTLASARVVLVVALVYYFPDVFNVIMGMALISPYTNQPFVILK
jgi:hypothetical protein